MRDWLAAAEWDASVWRNVAEKFTLATESVDQARDEGMAPTRWATLTRVLMAARDEEPKDLDTARSVFIIARSWDQQGEADALGAEYSKATEWVDTKAAALGEAVTSVASTVVPWAMLLAGGLVLVGAYLLLRRT